MDAEDIGKGLGSSALSKATDGGKDFGAELAARAAGTYKDPKMVAKSKKAWLESWETRRLMHTKKELV